MKSFSKNAYFKDRFGFKIHLSPQRWVQYAHLHLTYWLLNTIIRYQAKGSGIMHGGKEILHISYTRKPVTTTAQNTVHQLILIKESTEPNENLLEIYKSLQYKSYPFTEGNL